MPDKLATPLIQDPRDDESSLVTTEQEWTVKATLAFWAAILTAIGSWLFVIGSIGCYPHMSPTEGLVLTWIDYPFNAGAVAFLIANYFIYFQMINKRVQYTQLIENETVRFVAKPQYTLQHAGCLLNICGAILYQTGCAMPLLVSTESNFDHNLWSVLPGTIGSICFMIASTCEGEYNGWRNFNKAAFQSLPVWQSYLYFMGAALFLVGYVSGWNKKSYTSDPDFVTVWATATPWTIGSFCFLAGGHIDIFMWKQKNYGLGWARSLQDDSTKGSVDPKQQLMIIVYVLLIVSCIVDIGMGIAMPNLQDKKLRIYFVCDDIQVIATNIVILLLASVLHKTPPGQPFSTLLWLMRGIAMWDFGKNIYYWHSVITTDLAHFYTSIE